MYSWRSNPNLSGVSDSEYLGQMVLHLTAEISRDLDSPRLYFLRGNAYLDAGRFRDAISDYTKALELSPFDAACYNNRGIARRYMEDFDTAIDDYDRALSIDPEYRDAYTNRGVAYADKGKLALAIHDFNRAIELDPEFWFTYGQRGLALWALGKREEAEADYAMVRTLQSR